MKTIDSNTPFVAVAESRIGGRKENQDTCAWQDTPHGFLLLVCDGMGGGPSGKFASQMAADVIVNSVLDSNPTYDRRDVLARTGIGNTKIKWETTKRFNAGLEAMFLDSRVFFGFNFFTGVTSDLLSLQQLSFLSGLEYNWANSGKMKNTGFDFTLKGRPVVSKDWNVEVGASLGHYKNEITSLPNGNYTSSYYGEKNILTAVGQPAGVFYGYQTSDRVFASTEEAAAAGKEHINSKGRTTNNLYIVDATGAKVESAYIIGTGLAALSAACYLVRDGQMKGERIHIFEKDPIPGGACDGFEYPGVGYVMRGGVGSFPSTSFVGEFSCFKTSSMFSCKTPMAVLFWERTLLMAFITASC